MPKFTQIVHRRRQPDELPTPRVAIRNFCLECCGYSAKETELCTDPECWLFVWRFGKTPEDLKGNRKGNPLALAAARQKQSEQSQLQDEQAQSGVSPSKMSKDSS